MATNSTQQEAGGFMPPTLPSPPPSSHSTAISPLPHPRNHPIKRGSNMESTFMTYAENKLLDISGRYERRFNTGLDPDQGEEDLAMNDEIDKGYEKFADLAKDLESVLDAVWVSGTPSLQIPFLLNIANATSTYLEPFPFSPRRTFQLLHKLDHAFSSLLNGSDVETNEPLPGFEAGRRVTDTEKVRIRGIVEKTRTVVMNLFTGGDSVDGAVDLTEDEDDQMSNESDDEVTGTGRWEMEVAKVYERTLVDIGQYLERPGV